MNTHGAITVTLSKQAKLNENEFDPTLERKLKLILLPYQILHVE